MAVADDKITRRRAKALRHYHKPDVKRQAARRHKAWKERIKDLHPITADQLRSVLSYNENTGVFVWLVRPTRCREDGRAGNLNTDGYVRIKVLGKQYQAHRLAWLYMVGEWPPHEIDHINQCKSDNRFENLRLATRAQNAANIRQRHTNSQRPMKGVRWDKVRKRWRVTIVVNGETIELGCFREIEDAICARKKAEAKFQGAFASTI